MPDVRSTADEVEPIDPPADPSTPTGGALPVAKARPKPWKVALKAVIAIGILAYLLYKVPFASIWEAMLGAKWELLACSTVMTLFVYWTTADRLRRLLEVTGNGISTWSIFEINLSTLFYGLFLPGGNFTGIAIRFYRLSAEGQNALATGVALFTDRVVSTISLLMIGILFWLGARQEEGWYPLLIMSAALAAGIAVILLFLLAEKVPLLRPLLELALKWGGKPAKKIHQAIHDQAKLPAGTLTVVMVLSFVTHLFGIVAYVLIAKSLGIDIGWVAMGWIRSSIILATMIPLTPSGIGLREGASLLILTSMGVSEESAMAFSLLVFGMTILLVGLAGGLFEARRVTRF